MASPSRRINARQIALLHVARVQLGLDEDLYRLILEQEAGVTSAKQLTPAGFDKVMKRLRGYGFRRKPARRLPPAPGSPITREQQRKIAELYAELGWTDPKRQMGFNRRQTGAPWPQTRKDANKVIEGLKAMLKRERKGGGGPGGPGGAVVEGTDGG